jgi:hypothetical protein
MCSLMNNTHFREYANTDNIKILERKNRKKSQICKIVVLHVYEI